MLPPAFCWSKFGAEAGEAASHILARKEAERLLGDGTFLWGIGTSVAPSIPHLLACDTEPWALFSPMRSRAARRDQEPEVVVAWRKAIGIDGTSFSLPDGALVTSRLNGRRHHFALVCHREDPIDAGPALGWIDDAQLRNLRTGSRVGSSQVTSIVGVLELDQPSPRYPVAFHAALRPPYSVILEDPYEVPRQSL